jgi:hypothetical protein
MITINDINKPEPILFKEKELELFSRASDVSATIKTLEAGKPVLITSFYSNGLTLLKELKIHLKRKFPDKTFKEQRAYRGAYRKLSQLILIGWLELFYPEASEFLLPFTKVQGLNSAWQWYQNGIPVPVLRNKIHPYYGTYFPTRFDHLILFDNWLKRYSGPKKSAIDVGIGSGVLSFQMVKHGFQKVFGTDTNPNAIIGLKEFMGDTKLSRKVELDFASLFGKWEKPSELIVFNPPWLPAAHNLDSNDEAIYYNDTLFPHFFEAAKQRLLPDGKLLIIFSNLAQITKATNRHPVEDELAKGGRFQLEQCLNRTVKKGSDKTKRDQHWRASEEVELWVLTHA